MFTSRTGKLPQERSTLLLSRTKTESSLWPPRLLSKRAPKRDRNSLLKRRGTRHLPVQNSQLHKCCKTLFLLIEPGSKIDAVGILLKTGGLVHKGHGLQTLKNGNFLVKSANNWANFGLTRFLGYLIWSYSKQLLLKYSWIIQFTYLNFA